MRRQQSNDLDVSQIQDTRPCDRVLWILDHLVPSLVLIIGRKLVIFTIGALLTGFYLRSEKNGFSNNVIRGDSVKKYSRNALAIALPDKRWETVIVG